jgi:hypothetical protein
MENISIIESHVARIDNAAQNEACRVGACGIHHQPCESLRRSTSEPRSNTGHPRPGNRFLTTQIHRGSRASRFSFMSHRFHLPLIV